MKAGKSRALFYFNDFVMKYFPLRANLILKHLLVLVDLAIYNTPYSDVSQVPDLLKSHKMIGKII